ncbi:P-loop containing nucleoside triphosphate hydrolase protein [Xylariaceae sp. FL0804]|nr:P-loop containing nucleoside triphosphate hydrolase protein [Xylariaceae sp. FL0804]
MSGWEEDMKAALPEHAPEHAPAVGSTTNNPDAPARDNWSKELDLPQRQGYDYSEGNDGHEWGSSMAVYEWDGDEGDIGPEHPELEQVLFGDPDQREPQGIDFSKYDTINVTQEGVEKLKPIRTFQDAGLHPAMLRNVELSGYHVPTPIQQYCIPAVTKGYDVLSIAQTGSGKTAAYLIPILNKLMGKAKKLAAPRPSVSEFKAGTATRVRAEPLVVIVCPARELAIQIFNEARKFCYRSKLRPAVAYGGAPMREQIDQLQRGCDILVATPGRLIDFMERAHILTFRRVKYMVIDEADELLHEDWDLPKILTGGEQEEGNVKYMLFSATFPTSIRKLAKTHLAESYCRLKVGRVGKTVENIQQDIIYVEPYMKKQALVDLLAAQKPARTIIFVNSKPMADELDDLLWHQNFPCTSMHSDRTQREREDAMRAFRAGNAPVMITTGVTARGIDVRNVMHVVNFDLPSMDHGGIEEYVHRIGRTGRIGHRGLATSFYTERDEGIAPLLCMLLLENHQPIPDFLEGFAPENRDVTKLKFEEYGSDEEPEDGFGTGVAGDGDAWGAPTGAPTDEGAWGAEAEAGTSAGGGWGADGDAGAGGDDGWGAPTANTGSW